MTINATPLLLIRIDDKHNIPVGLEKSERRINSPYTEDEEPTEIFPRMDSVKN